jgi:hypothetical protein
LATGFFATGFATFLAGTAFLGAGLAAFLGAALTVFLAATAFLGFVFDAATFFAGAAFLGAGLAFFTGFATFLGAGFFIAIIKFTFL